MVVPGPWVGELGRAGGSLVATEQGGSRSRSRRTRVGRGQVFAQNSSVLENPGAHVATEGVGWVLQFTTHLMNIAVNLKAVENFIFWKIIYLLKNSIPRDLKNR